MTSSFRERYGPCALVAGAAVGLGAEWARQVAAQGLDLILVDRDAGALDATVDEIRRDRHVAVHPVALDLARPALVAALHPHVAGREIGLLVYNAALGFVAPFLEMRADQLQATLDVNCRGPLFLAHAFLPAMVRRGRGGVVLMSSL